MGIPVYHMEAGNRCYDTAVPEEVNRRIIDHCVTFHMPYTSRSAENLTREGIRREDIHVLVQHFLDKYNKEYEKNVSKTSREVMDALLEYHWPGNVRELESCIERAVVLTAGDTLSMSLLPVNIRSFRKPGC